VRRSCCTLPSAPSFSYRQCIGIRQPLIGERFAEVRTRLYLAILKAVLKQVFRFAAADAF